jgi:transposase
MKMKLNNCKLKKNIQPRLLEYFLLEVTARSAANLLDISQIQQLFSIK